MLTGLRWRSNSDTVLRGQDNYPVDGERLEVLIYKTDRHADWVLEVVTSDGASTVWQDTFIGAEMAWRVFEDTVEQEGIRAFLDEDDPRMTLH